MRKSFERIHRSNLVGMGVLPLEFTGGDTAQSLNLKGDEIISIDAVTGPQAKITVRIIDAEGVQKNISALVRIDTEKEFDYYCHGGILPYSLRSILSASSE